MRAFAVVLGGLILMTGCAEPTTDRPRGTLTQADPIEWDARWPNGVDPHWQLLGKRWFYSRCEAGVARIWESDSEGRWVKTSNDDCGARGARCWDPGECRTDGRPCRPVAWAECGLEGPADPHFMREGDLWLYSWCEGPVAYNAYYDWGWKQWIHWAEPLDCSRFDNQRCWSPGECWPVNGKCFDLTSAFCGNHR